MKITASILCLSLLLLSCSSQKSTDPGALSVYLNELDALRKTDLEENAVSAFCAVSGKKKRGDKALFQALSRCTLPNYSAFYRKLKAIRPADTRLSNLHSIYMEGARYQLLAFSNVSEYLISRETRDLRRFQEQSRYARELIHRWRMAFNRLLLEAGKKLTPEQ